VNETERSEPVETPRILCTVRTARTAVLVALAVALLVALALPAAACPVCYGEAEGEMIQGTQWSVAFLGLLVYGLLGGVGALVLVQRRRLQRLTRPQAEPFRDPLPATGGAPPAAAASHSDSDRPSKTEPRS